MLRLIRNLVVIVALVLGVAFGFFNYDLVSVDLLWTTTEAPLVVLLAVAFVIGFLITLLVCGVRIARLRSQLSSAQRKLKDARSEISNLRSLPIHDA
ncbi:membrane protein [Salinisphaera orenii MK-B5]|mgnify:CR=1 FL=1|uniref:Membrane protein n=1 Tax=Salinisphaera orenii MK-B5 TaxID=856730 RepID=A0A423PS03_9GAMM|nr:LapA family protein [Salinisphaera orenii]ROO28301.1 membrane protein [Salinisphaera orenii MK-B5]